jgi:ABC-2 type transport system permease protein
MSDLALTWRQYRLERRLFWRNPSAAFFNFLFPLIFLALFGSIASGDQASLDIIVPGIAGMSVMSATFTALSYNITALRDMGVLKRLRGTPMPTGSWLGGVMANAVTNAAIQIAIVIVAGHVFWGVDGLAAPLELIVFVAVGVGCFASLGVAFSHVIPNVDSAPAYVNVVFLPAIAISGVFYDADNGPAFLRDVAQVLPLKHLIDGLSSAMVTGAPLSDNLGNLAVLAAWGLFGVYFAVRGFTWEARRR